MTVQEFMERGRIAQEEVNRIIHTLHTGGSVEVCPECRRATVITQKTAGGPGAAVNASPESRGKAGPRTGESLAAAGRSQSLPQDGPSAAPPTCIGVHAGVNDQRGRHLAALAPKARGKRKKERWTQAI